MAKKIGWQQRAQELMRDYPEETKGMSSEQVMRMELAAGGGEDVDTTGLSSPTKPAAPLVKPLAAKRTGRNFWTKEAMEEKVAAVVAASKAAAKQRAVGEASRTADRARWDSMPPSKRLRYGTFENWVQSVYSDRTESEAALLNAKRKPGEAPYIKRDKPSFLTGTLRVADNLMAPPEPGAEVDILDEPTDNPITAIFRKVYQATGGMSDEDANLSEYMRLRSPERDQTLSETGGQMLDAIADDAPGALREMFLNPRSITTNAASLIPVAGPVGIGTKLAKLPAIAKAGSLVKNVASKAPVIGRGLGKGLEVTGKAGGYLLERPLAEIGSGAAIGGLTNMGLGEGNDLNNFILGAGPGAVIGGGGMLARKPIVYGGKKIAGWYKGKKPDAPANTVLHPVDEIVQQSRANRRPIGGELPELSAEDVGAAIDAMARNPTSSNFSDKVKVDFFNKHADLIDPTFRNLSPEDQVRAANSLIQKIAEQRKMLKQNTPDANAQAKTKEKIEAAKQSLPSSLDGDSDVWFTTGTKKQQDDKLIKGAKAYRFLREQGVIEPNPRFEGKTDVDLLTERIKQIQKETDDALAAKAETPDQKAMKDELLKENEFRSEALQNEIDWAQKKEQTLSDINFAQNVQLLHKIPGRTLDEFKSLPVEHQGILLRDIDEMGSAGDYIREALGPLFDDLRRIASTSGYDPKRLRSKIDEAVKVMKASYGNPSDGINGTVGGSPTGRAAGAGQQAADGVYRDVPQQGMAPMDPSIAGQSQQAIGFSEPTAAAPAPQQAISGSAPGQIGYDPNRAGGQINLPDQSTGQPPIAMRDEPIGSRNELLGSYGDKQAEAAVRRERLIQKKSEAEIQKILYDEILKNPDKAELFGIDRDIAIEAADPDSPFKGDLKNHLTDAARGVKANGIPKGFF